MTSAFILIFSVLILGGILAALGDRLGSKVGKARLSLFNLRPKQTAVVVTVITGTIISASTLGLLFGLSKSLRQGVFQLDQILAQRRKELQEISDEKKQIEDALEQAREDQLVIQGELAGTEKKFEEAQSQLTVFRDQASMLEREIDELAAEQQDLKRQRDELAAQREALADQNETIAAESEALQLKVGEQNGIIEERSGQITALETQQQALQGEIEQRDRNIATLDEAIAAKDEILQNVETQILTLEDQIDILEASYISFRSGNVSLTTGQVLAFGVVRIIDSNAVNQAVDQLLREANRNAIIATAGRNANFDERVVQITNAQVQNLIAEINDGRDYVVRLLAAGNYIQGETQVQVFADAVLKEEVYQAGTTIARVSLEDLSVANPTVARQPIDFLLGAAQFRARQDGVLGDIQVHDGDLSHITDFADAINQSLEPITEIRAIALQNADNAGPLRLQLVALSNGRLIFRSEEINNEAISNEAINSE